ncbi:beta-lactamase/transpeptidase-like protein [Dichomitus squalens LYAD-421 SS1]|uniref:Beta-lactamase/transpeptidase-like protein n=1 Tax=Dichomitus squalens (strain LYAD-421) TaxID=732165 RepID=R7T1V7_DICSQ|nr:beta-lactamase/transpeptidase-like protein [Dichomitus squalens LYAD-421 SS1]EJF61945.1 beta-lactamase/transpeptidase-like protein [Dichomitus squalens LYAD-421 SS1]
MWKAAAVAIGLLSIALSGYHSGYVQIRTSLSTDHLSDGGVERWSCRPFLPRLFVETPPSPLQPKISRAADRLHAHFSERFSKGDIDSLSVAVVTSNNVLFEKNHGVMRANETGSLPTYSHSMYRIASVAKMFNVLEGFILEQKGLISWDDPIDKYIKDFHYVATGLDRATAHHAPPLTLRQLATHMSGLGRDWPPGTVPGWPHDMRGMGPPPTNGLPFPSYDALLASISKHHLTSPPGAYPAYSNAGTALLAYALAIASATADGKTGKISYADLVKRDIFGPLGMNGSHFLATEANRHLVVVPSLAPEVADQDFLDAMNPAAGQFSSLADLITVTQTLLNPRHPKSLLTPYSLDTWFHTAHAFEEDDWTEMGFIWEIVKARDSNGRLRKIYWKLGAMAGYHAALAIHPGTGYGVIVLMTGHYPDAAKLAYDTFEIFQPAIDQALAELAAELYVGEWYDVHGSEEQPSSARIVIDKGTLYIKSLKLLGVDALRNFGAPGRLALRSSQRRDEFRIDTGIPGYNGQKHMGCYPYWNGQDLWGVRQNAAVNAIYFSGDREGRLLHVPSLSIAMTRK